MLKSKFTLILYLLAIPVFFTSCDDDNEGEDMVMPTGNETEYNLTSLTDENISGTATFIENENSTTVVLNLSNTSGTEVHPAHIHANTAVEGGNIVISLEPVDPATGTSSTEITATDAGDAITYEQLIDFDGYINVHQSESDLGTILAQGDIGQNDLTGTTKSYELAEKAVEGISGTITFAERINGEALATIDLEGTPDGGEHPAHIHFNSYVEGGGIAFTFTPVDGSTGMSLSHVDTLDDGESFVYEDVLAYDGYINVHLSADELATIVAQGDIGVNELTGNEKIYTLDTKDVEGISGTATFQERISGEALATLSLEGTPDGGEHPAHIHFNSYVEGGGIAFTFTPVDGSTGMSLSHVDTLDDGESFVYEDVLAYDGYINVHLSADELATIVAQGDIGSNAPE
jgi:Cu/Zn superoxide dismutase